MIKLLGIAVFGAFFAWASVAAELPDVTEEALADLGITMGTPQMNGFVFIEGRYIPPPYTVTRKGNAIFVNRIQIEQPVPWPRPASAPAAAAVPAAAPAKKAVDADGDFQQVGDAAAEKTDKAGAAPAAGAAKPKAVKSIDDLFDDDAPAKPAAAEKAAPAAPAAAQPAPAAAVFSSELSPEDVAKQKEALLAGLERLRKGYEQALAQNEFFFFGLRHNRVNGNYGTARTLMGVLPKALRYAQSPLDLMQRLNEGGVYFLDTGICAALYRNKSTFPMLEERLAKIEESEEFEALKRKAAPRW